MNMMTYKTFTHPGQPQMQVEVILASRAINADGDDQGPPLYTIRMRYPRIIHGEIMTHRVFSRNARSSRAVPVKTMLLECTTMPFIPWHWGKNQKGMQASEVCNELVNFRTFWQRKDGTHTRHYGTKIDHTSTAAWLAASEYAVEVAEGFMEAGYHKQIPNRLLEPFSWIDTLITSRDWNNFLWLRDHADAEPHLQDLARLVKQAIVDAEVQILEPGEWHTPYIIPADRDTVENEYNDGRTPSHVMLCKLSAARCARISYKPFDGDASYERELERYDMLVSSDRVHASPLEHQATPDEPENWDSAELAEIDNLGISIDKVFWQKSHVAGNLGPGWIQFRKTIPNENYTNPHHTELE